MNTFGTYFRLTDFGESHGTAIGGVIDGMPAGFEIDFDALRKELDRRRPGQSLMTSQRNETDEVEWLSGIFNGRTLGTPIGFIIRNTDARSADYEALAGVFRPNHADYTYNAKYGYRDYRGGGRASARETAVRVVAGALARQILAAQGISITAWASQVGHVVYSAIPTDDDKIYESDLRCPDYETASMMAEAIEDARKDNDTLGGVVSCRVSGMPAGIGEPVFGKLHAMLASAMMSINAAKGFEYGDGFAAAAMKGSECVDAFVNKDGRIVTSSNHSGGIQGGITNGADINFRVAFKPVATMSRPLDTVTASGESAVITATGRHDICVVPRAVAVVEAMTAITLLDALMASFGSKL